MPAPRHIVHLDADAFFASVEQASDVRLRGRPVAVGGEKRGIIASASYEARKLGIYTPMPTVRARKLCPRLVVLPGDFEKYERFSRWMFSYAHDFTPDVEITSIDEGYFDLSGVSQPPLQVAETVRDAIRQALKISVSEGIASCKLVSQVASKLRKPAAFVHVPAGAETDFLHPLPSRWLPGVGPQLATRLQSAGLALIGQVAATPLEMLHLLLGRSATALRDFACGLDPRPIVTASLPAQSFSRQQTFAKDVTDEEYVAALLRHQADDLMATVRAEGKSIRTLTVRVRYNDMDEEQCGESLAEPTDLEVDLYARLTVLLRRAWSRRVSLRMVGLKLSNVYAGVCRTGLTLGPEEEQLAARRRLAAAVDELRREHGRATVLRGHDFRLREAPTDSTEALRTSAPVPARYPAPIPRRRPPVVETGVLLNVHSGYSFMRSTLTIERAVQLAAEAGCPALGLTDEGNLHGAVEFSLAARRCGVKPVLGAEVRLAGRPAWLYVENATGYRNLCRLLSLPALRGRGEGMDRGRRPDLDGETLASRGEGLILVAENPGWAERFTGRFYCAVTHPEAAEKIPPGVPALALPSVRHARPEDRRQFDILQAIGTGTLLGQAHPDKLGAEAAGPFLQRGDWQRWGEAGAGLVRTTRELAERCSFALAPGPPQFPAFHPPGDGSPGEYLHHLVQAGLRRRYRERAGRFQAQANEELSIIREVGYEEYFLIVWELLQECHQQGIQWITRGSAADSLVCYCLGISDVCPIRFDLYFRRFLNRERMSLNKLPDIDIDFAHDEKDRVIDLIFARHGRERVAVVGGFSTFQARSAVAEAAKALGVSEHQARRFTEHFPWANATEIGEALRQSQECRDLPLTEEPYRTAVEMAACLDGFPRYPKMHPCGVVISRQPMLELTPVFLSSKGYPTTHFDMDAVEAIGLVKIDILAQGGLAVMRDVQTVLTQRGEPLSLPAPPTAADLPVDGSAAAVPPWGDPAVWELIATGQARAVHHIESPAMLGLCKMCNVREIDGLVAIVSVIRPGAANEQKKTRFTRRYQGLEPVTYTHPSLEPCLRGTFGLVVYEEHVLQICEAFAGLPPGQADLLRRALGKGKTDVIARLRDEFLASARQRGHPEAKIAEVWELVSGFAGYAFCKAHSTAYAVEAYQAAWLKCYHPAEFMAAVLTNGKGFYPPLVYVLECHRIGLRLLSPTVNDPGPAFTVHGCSLRVPVTRLKGLTEQTCHRLLREHARARFVTLADFYIRVAPPPAELEILIRAGALDELGGSRTEQFWEAQHWARSFGADQAGQGWLLPQEPLRQPAAARRSEPSRQQCLEWENELLGYPASGHPLELHPDIAWDTYCPVRELGNHVGERVVTCGLVIEQRIHQQETGELMKFLSLADWTGMVETELFADTYRSFGLATVRYPVLEVVAVVEPFENGRGHSLRVLRAGKPRHHRKNR